MIKPLHRNSRNVSNKAYTSDSSNVHYHDSLLDYDSHNKGKTQDHYRSRGRSLVFLFHIFNIYGAIVLSLFSLTFLNALYTIYFDWGLQILPHMRKNGPVCNHIMGNSEVEVVELYNHEDKMHKNHGRDDKRFLSNLSSQEFYDLYVRKRKVVHIRNAYDNETLSWNREVLSDASLLREFANSSKTITVETDLKETRNEDNTLQMTVSEFIESYQKPDKEMYAVIQWKHIFDLENFRKKRNASIQKVQFLGLFEDFLRSSGMPIDPFIWWSVGKTSSKIHFDEAHNFETILYGPKTFYVCDASNVDDLGFPNDATLFRNRASEIDFQSVHGNSNSEDTEKLRQFPRFKDVKWHRVHLVPGDVIFIPKYTPHFVYTPDAQNEEGKKSMAINFFWGQDMEGLVRPQTGRNGIRMGNPTSLEICLRYLVLKKLSQLLGTRTFAYHAAVNMILDFVFLFVKIIRASSQFWMDVLLNKSAYFKIQITENHLTPSKALVAHQYCREVYPYETFYSNDSNDTSNNNNNSNDKIRTYMNFTVSENIAAFEGRCTSGIEALNRLGDFSRKKYNNCGCDTPRGAIRSMEIIIMIISISSGIFIPFSPVNNDNNYIRAGKKISRQHRITIIFVVAIIVFIIPLPIYYLMYINGKGLVFDSVLN